MPSLNHIHEYIRSRTNKNIFRCIHPDCTHFAPRELLEGKRAICTLCKSEFNLDWAQLKNRVPRCLNCSKSNAAKAHRATRDTLADILAAAQELEESTRQ